MIQDTDVITQFNRLDMRLDNASAMISALYEAEGRDVSSTSSDADADVSNGSSPRLKAGAPVELGMVDNHGDDCNT